MPRITLDALTLERLKIGQLVGSVAFQNDAGQVVGYFHPIDSQSVQQPKTPFDRAELERRREQRNGRPMKEVLSELGRS